MVEIVTTEEECKKIWNQISDDKTLFENWEFRNGWNKGQKYSYHFIVSKRNNKLIACLPLAYSPREKRFEWFGSDYMERNHIYAESPESLKDVFINAPTPLYLNSISGETKVLLDAAGIPCKIDRDPRNELDISAHTTLDSLLATFSKKHRYNLLRDSRKLDTLKPKIEVMTSDFDRCFRTLHRLSAQRFGDKWDGENGSYFGVIQIAFKRALVRGVPYNGKFVIVRIGRKIAAIDLIIMYRNIYYLMATAQNSREFNGIGNFLLRWELEDAIRNKSMKIDCLQEDHGWKHRYFTQEDVYIVDK